MQQFRAIVRATGNNEHRLERDGHRGVQTRHSLYKVWDGLCIPINRNYQGQHAAPYSKNACTAEITASTCRSDIPGKHGNDTTVSAKRNVVSRTSAFASG